MIDSMRYPALAFHQNLYILPFGDNVKMTLMESRYWIRCEYHMDIPRLALKSGRQPLKQSPSHVTLKLRDPSMRKGSLSVSHSGAR